MSSSPSSSRTFVIGSRASALAKVQTYIVRDALQAAFPDKTFDTRFMTTGGDKNQTQALYLISGGKSLWTEELEESMLKGDIDIIVHSLKDMPTSLPDRCELGAIMEREDPRDSLVVKKGLPYRTLEELPDGSVVGTSSVRRVAQLRRAFPKLVFADIRGNLNTRLAKLDSPTGECTAIILARAGLVRLDMAARITSDISPPNLYHAVGQGALGIEIRSGDDEVASLLRILSHTETELRCRAERACLRVLEGGCSVPVGVASSYSEVPSEDETPVLSLTGTVTSLTNSSQVLHSLSAPVTTFAQAESIGEAVGRALIENGANAILDEVNKERDAKNARDAAKKQEDAIAAAAAAAAAFSAASSPAAPLPLKRIVASSSSSPSSSPSLVPISLAEESSSEASSSSSSITSPKTLRLRASSIAKGKNPHSLAHIDSFLNPAATPAEALRYAVRVRTMPGAWPEDINEQFEERNEEEVVALGQLLEKMHVEGLGVGRETFEKVAGKEGKAWRAAGKKYIH